jgi:hypothetical protein
MFGAWLLGPEPLAAGAEPEQQAALRQAARKELQMQRAQEPERTRLA